jgi:hypothetical protein
LLCVGLDAQSRSLFFLHGDGAPYAPDEKTADRICGEFQSQDVDYVLGFFGRTVGAARKAYGEYVEEGVEQGRREELEGGGLI